MSQTTFSISNLWAAKLSLLLTQMPMYKSGLIAAMQKTTYDDLKSKVK